MPVHPCEKYATGDELIQSLDEMKQAPEATLRFWTKLLIGKKAEEGLIHVNLGKNEFNKIKVEKRKDCKVCKGKFDYLEGKINKDLCGR